MKIYIDETGNLGKQGRYFVITALVLRNEENGNKRLKNIVKNFLAKSEKDEIKGVELLFPERQKIITKLNKKKDHYYFYICLDKQNLENKKLLEDQSILFNYLCKFLFVDIYKAFSPHNKRLDIYVDQRNVKHKSLYSLGEYVKLFTLGDLNFETDINLNYYDSKDVKLIQLADFASGIIHNFYKTKKMHDYKNLQIKGKNHFPIKCFGK